MFAFYMANHRFIQIVMFQTPIIRPYLEPVQYIPWLYSQLIEKAF